MGELSTHSREFARLWGKHDVRLCSSGTERLHNPQVGDLDLHYEVQHLPDSNGQRLQTHTSAVGERSGGCAGAVGVRARCWATGCHSLTPRGVLKRHDLRRLGGGSLQPMTNCISSE